jgi:hypothetical protein
VARLDPAGTIIWEPPVEQPASANGTKNGRRSLVPAGERSMDGIPGLRAWRALAIGFALTGAMSVCGHSRADQPIHSVVSNGSELKVWLKAAEAVIISYLEMNPGRHRLDLTSQNGSSLREFLSDETATIAFTGGYLKSFLPPSPTGYICV